MTKRYVAKWKKGSKCVEVEQAETGAKTEKKAVKQLRQDLEKRLKKAEEVVNRLERRIESADKLLAKLRGYQPGLHYRDGD